jgi:hypothetical protein
MPETYSFRGRGRKGDAMSTKISVPFLIDIIRVRSPEMIRSLANHGLLDRGFHPSGPLINRIVAGRARRVLSVKGALLPSAALRGSVERASRQEALERALNPEISPPPWDMDLLRSLSAFVRGEGQRPLGLDVQEIIGRLFVPDYRATEQTWAAATTLDAALRVNNPLRRIYWAITRQIPRAQHTLSRAAGEDLACVHATGIAAHNLVTSIEGMAALYRDEGTAVRLEAKAAVARCLVAPRTVLRQSRAAGASLAGDLAPGTLVTLATREAGERSLDPRISFLRDSWSQCPAHHLVPTLLAAIWQDAIDHKDHRESGRVKP